MARGRRAFVRDPGGIRRRVLLFLAAVALVVGVAAVVLAIDATGANGALNDAASQARALRRDISDGESKAAVSTLRDLQRSTTTARKKTDGPLWATASHLPFLGDSVSAVRTTAVSLDDIAQRGAPPIVKVSTSLDADLFRPDDGAFDLKKIAAVAPSVITASEVLTKNREAIDAIDPDDLIGPLRDPVDELKDAVATAQKAATSAATALRLAPDMLGDHGTRRYLVLFQNNAEARATGGIPGSVAVLTAKDGRVSLGDPVSAKDIGTFDQPVVRLTDDEKATYGTTLASDFRDITLTPDFPRTAEIAREMVRRRLDVDIDGVVSIDPVALSYALKGIGPVEVADDTTLTAANAVDILLNTVYARYEDPDKQDAFFADSAKRIFDRIIGGAGSSRRTLEGLAKSVAEGRILVWSADAAEENRLVVTKVGGHLAGRSNAPDVGVYLSDTVSSKMQYYLRYDANVTSQRCTRRGAQHLQLDVALRSTAPADATLLPAYIAGSGKRAAPGSQRVNLRIFGPRDGTFERLEVNGKPTIAGRGSDLGRPVLIHSVLLKPGQQVALAVTMTSGPGQRGDVVLSHTPGIESMPNNVRFDSTCD